MARKKLILHIGRHKSGTSSIQRFLMARQDALAAQGAIYPVTGRRPPNREKDTPAHHGLAELFQGRFGDAEAASIKRAFDAEIAGFDTVIVSSEALQNIGRLDRLREFFDGFEGFEPHVICYLREWLAYTVSAFLQRVQNHNGFQTFGEFAGRQHRIEAFIRRWSSFERIDFRPYDRERLIQGDVIADFLEIAALPVAYEPLADANPSIGGNLLYARMVANRLELPFLGYLQQMRAARSSRSFRLPFHISEERAAALRDDSSFNRVVFDLVGDLKLKGYAEYPTLPEAETLNEDLRALATFGDVPAAFAAIADYSGDTGNWF